MGPGDRHGDRRHLARGARAVDPWPEAADDRQPMVPALCGLLRREDDRHPHVGPHGRDGIVERRRHHADDPVPRRVDRQRRVEHGWRRRVAPAPVRVAEDDDVGPSRLILVRRKGSPERRFGTEYAEQRRGRAHRLNPYDLRRLAHVPARHAICRQRLERPRLLAPVMEVRDRHRNLIVRPLGGERFVDAVQPIGLAEGERLQQHRAHDAENGGVRADAERETEHRDEGQPALLAQRSHRETQILDESLRAENTGDEVVHCSRLGGVKRRGTGGALAMPLLEVEGEDGRRPPRSKDLPPIPCVAVTA